MNDIGWRWVGDGDLDMMIRHEGGKSEREKGNASMDGHWMVVEAIKQCFIDETIDKCWLNGGSGGLKTIENTPG